MSPRASAAPRCSRAPAFFAPSGRGFSLYTLDGRDDDLRNAVGAAGLAVVREAAPLMARHERGGVFPPPPGVVLRRVHRARGPGRRLAPHVAPVVAYDAEGPVATAMAIATQGTAYVAWVGTVTRAQRRGLGAAVTHEATVAGFGLGARVATLLASPMGAPVYRRMGWEDVASLTYHVESARPS